MFTDHGFELPLPDQGTVSESERYDQGRALQTPLYGQEIRDDLATLPTPFDQALPRLLTEHCFGDTPEPVSQVGNSTDTVLAALVHCLPYLGSRGPSPASARSRTYKDV